MGTSAQVRPTGENNCLYVVFEKKGRKVGAACSPTGQVRWGPSVGIEFSYPVPGVEKAEEVFQDAKGSPRLIYHQGMTGYITVRANKIELSDMLALGLVQGQSGQQWIRLTGEMSGRFEYRGIEVAFEFGPAPDSAEAPRLSKMSRQYNRSFFPREDWPFAALSIFLYLFIFLFAVYLKTVPIDPDLSNKPMPKRIAKLIYEAPQALTRARKEILKKTQEEKLAAEQAEKKLEEEPPKEEEKPKEEKPKTEPEKTKPTESPAESQPPVVQPKIDEPMVAKTPPKPQPRVETAQERRVKIQKKVAKKGLLGLLGGKGSASTSKSRGSILQGSGAAVDLDRVIENSQGLRAGVPDGADDGSEDGDGIEVAEVTTTIDEAAMEVASLERTVKLEEREAQAVEVAEEVEMDDLTIKEAVAAVHRVVGTYLGQLRYLYNRELRTNPDLEGKLTVSMTISPEGLVTESRVVESTMGNAGFEKAVLARVQKWKFELAVSKPITVEYPFVFFPSM